MSIDTPDPEVESDQESSDTLIDIEMLARRLGVTPRMVRRLVHERSIPSLRIGRHVRFSQPDIDAWLVGRRVAER